jgi:hypothetical protein
MFIKKTVLEKAFIELIELVALFASQTTLFTPKTKRL